MERTFDYCWLPPLGAASGVPASPAMAAELELRGLNIPFELEINGGGDAFTIRKDAGAYRISGGETGVLYGAHRLRALLALNGAAEHVSVSEQPSFKYRILNHWDNADGTVERGYAGRSLFFNNGEVEYDAERIRYYARLLASVGINAISVNNVNVRPDAVALITQKKLPALSRLAELFRPYGVRLILSVNYASPIMLGELDTADPLSDSVARWWKDRADLIYSYVPDLLGVIVKADSENQPGPFNYGRDHADGANVLAKALAPHNGCVFWRCFVYNCKQDWRDTQTDRPKAAYDVYKPLDGRFDGNVILQIKNGPYDFQIREPVSPLLGATANTAQALEFQITQEYTGQQIDLCFLPVLWREVLDFDTRLRPGGTVAGMAGNEIQSVAAVANIGNNRNWTGNALAGANLYGYGRMAWDARISPEAVADEYCGLMFNEPSARKTAAALLLKSRRVYEAYTTPLGMGWFVKPHLHYGPDPLGYEFSLWGTYHRADSREAGIDRTARGTGFTAQYAPELAALYDNLHTCPEELLLFFHRVPYNHRLRNGMTLLQYLYDCHFRGAEEAGEMLAEWRALENAVPEGIFNNVLERLLKQRDNAAEWRDVFNTFFYRLTGESDALGRRIYA